MFKTFNEQVSADGSLILNSKRCWFYNYFLAWVFFLSLYPDKVLLFLPYEKLVSKGHCNLFRDSPEAIDIELSYERVIVSEFKVALKKSKERFYFWDYEILSTWVPMNQFRYLCLFSTPLKDKIKLGRAERDQRQRPRVRERSARRQPNT